MVAGTNYEIEMSTSAGPLTIRVYEQLWTGTLTVTSASVRNAGNRLGVYAVLQDGEEHAMDAADFETLLSPGGIDEEEGEEGAEGSALETEDAGAAE